MFWKKKGKGISKEKFCLMVQVKFMFLLMVCLNNSCLNHRIEGTLSKGLISVHTELEYLVELKWIMLAYSTNIHFSQVLFDHFC